MRRRSVTVRALVGGALFLAAAASLTISCVEPENFATLSSGGSAHGRGVGFPGEPGDALSPAPPAGDAGALAFVACTSSPRGSDAGDAAALDAGTLDAASPCAEPPAPACLSPVDRVTYRSGSCVDGACVFVSSVEKCPGGCFRQIDGGLGCND